MNTSFKKYLSFFKRKPVDSFKILIAPDHDWKTLFLCFWASFFLIALWSGYLYFSYTMMTFQEPGVSDLPTPLSKDSFKSVFDSFDERAEAFEAARLEAKALEDPR